MSLLLSFYASLVCILKVGKMFLQNEVCAECPGFYDSRRKIQPLLFVSCWLSDEKIHNAVVFRTKN